MTYDEWEGKVPEALTGDTLWRVKAYRLALFLSDLGWRDSASVATNRRLTGVADQLYRATSNVSSNIAEGYSRGSGRDRARFYEYALGSVRESRDWYFKGRHVLKQSVITHRFGLCTELLRLLLKMTSNERTTNRRVRKSQPKE